MTIARLRNPTPKRSIYEQKLRFVNRIFQKQLVFYFRRWASIVMLKSLSDGHNRHVQRMQQHRKRPPHRRLALAGNHVGDA